MSAAVDADETRCECVAGDLRTCRECLRAPAPARTADEATEGIIDEVLDALSDMSYRDAEALAGAELRALHAKLTGGLA